MGKISFTNSKELLHNYAEDKNIPQIVTDFDDMDFYKFNMLFFFFKKMPNMLSEWQLFNRGKHEFPIGFGNELKKQAKGFEKLRFTPEIEQNLREKAVGKNGQCYYDETFFTFLRGMRFDSSDISIIQHGTDLDVKFTGYHHNIKFYEIYLMSTIVELRNIMLNNIPTATIDELDRKDISKFMLFDKCDASVSEFGTRRRFSKANQERVIQNMVKHKCCVGTSNVMFSRLYNIKAIGTSAHSLISALACKYGVMQANAEYLGQWAEIFHGECGLMLTDTFTTDVFLKSFDSLHLKNTDGVRWDSGDAFEFTDKIVAHYKKNGIDPMEKTIAFTDSIRSERTVQELVAHCKGRIKCSFGIGTWLSNDVCAPDSSMNIVIKLTKVLPANRTNWQFAVKLSDDNGKTTSIDQKTVELYKYQIGLV